MPEEAGTEIGATRGKTHARVLQDTLGRERGLKAATGESSWEGPLIEGDVVEKEKAAAAESTDAHAEITEKKIERHGDVGGER